MTKIIKMMAVRRRTEVAAVRSGVDGGEEEEEEEEEEENVSSPLRGEPRRLMTASLGQVRCRKC